MRRIFIVILGLTLCAGSSVSADGGPMNYKNCTDLLKDYPRGVSMSILVARASGAENEPDSYNLNKAKDLDGDGAACEDAAKKKQKCKGLQD